MHVITHVFFRQLPDLIGWESINKKDKRGNLKKAFHSLKKNWNVPMLLDIDQMVFGKDIDEKCVMTYVALCFEKFGEYPVSYMKNKRKGSWLFNLIKEEKVMGFEEEDKEEWQEEDQASEPNKSNGDDIMIQGFNALLSDLETQQSKNNSADTSAGIDQTCNNIQTPLAMGEAKALRKSSKDQGKRKSRGSVIKFVRKKPEKETLQMLLDCAVLDPDVNLNNQNFDSFDSLIRYLSEQDSSADVEGQVGKDSQQQIMSDATDRRLSAFTSYYNYDPSEEEDLSTTEATDLSELRLESDTESEEDSSGDLSNTSLGTFCSSVLTLFG